MLLYIYKMGVHWYFWFEVKTSDNRSKMLNYKALKQIKQNVDCLDDSRVLTFCLRAYFTSKYSILQ